MKDNVIQIRLPGATGKERSVSRRCLGRGTTVNGEKVYVLEEPSKRGPYLVLTEQEFVQRLVDFGQTQPPSLREALRTRPGGPDGGK
jgi:hypothetical protein